MVLRLECTNCKTKAQLALKRCKHFELGYVYLLRVLDNGASRLMLGLQRRQEDEGCCFGILDGFMIGEVWCCCYDFAKEHYDRQI